jgi:hypothetical protein
MPRLKALLLSLATLCAPAALAQSANLARPGTLNYIEGSATIDGQPLTPRSVGSVELEPGQILETGNGKVELLLTPGIFLRLDDHSAIKMVTPNLTNTQVELEHGKAAVEVDEIHKQNNIQISTAANNTRLLKEGYYEFDTNTGSVRVFNGKAAVAENNGDNSHPVELKDKHQLTLAASQPLKPVSFDTKSAQDDLYNWSSLRSQYLSEANTGLAAQYAGYGGFSPGWYWNSAFWGYTWLPGDGMFWNPFGWGFYSPWWIYGGGPIYRGGFYGRGGYYRGYVGHVASYGSGFHGGATGGGFHGSMSGGGHAGGGGGHR